VSTEGGLFAAVTCDLLPSLIGKDGLSLLPIACGFLSGLFLLFTLQYVKENIFRTFFIRDSSPPSLSRHDRTETKDSPPVTMYFQSVDENDMAEYSDEDDDNFSETGLLEENGLRPLSCFPKQPKIWMALGTFGVDMLVDGYVLGVVTKSGPSSEALLATALLIRVFSSSLELAAFLELNLAQVGLVVIGEGLVLFSAGICSSALVAPLPSDSTMFVALLANTVAVLLFVATEGLLQKAYSDGFHQFKTQSENTAYVESEAVPLVHKSNNQASTNAAQPATSLTTLSVRDCANFPSCHTLWFILGFFFVLVALRLQLAIFVSQGLGLSPASVVGHA